ncbi:hypothetical protein LSH36_25g07043 [Paralvinella palmiformis]|uniref:Dynactin subunit 6 n=1 Tax=Paralvinella palmiformis TaxID=53620 RepID=A0AAD9KAB1_9ANNE|nr:hypothetical protein LSH36_25g07043 [Paralvinella palmiformis]
MSRSRDDGKNPSSNQRVLIIGNYNVFEVGSHTEAVKIGDNNVLEAKAVVGRNTILSNGCIIGAMCHVTSNEVLPENTVIFGSNYERRVQHERPQPQTLQLDFLTKILPNYHHLRKPTKTPAPSVTK